MCVYIIHQPPIMVAGLYYKIRIGKIYIIGKDIDVICREKKGFIYTI